MTTLRLIFRVGLLLMIMALAVAPAFAQEETTYEDPAGRFSAAIPEGWTDESTSDYGLFTKDDLSVYLLAVEADDVQEGIRNALNIVAPDLEGEPVQSSEIPVPNGIWTQNVYVHASGLTVAIGQVEDGITYAMVVQSPDQPTLVASTNEVNGILLGFTIGEAIDLVGVTPAEFTDEMLSDLDSYIREALEGFEMPGAAVAVVQGDEVVYANGFGLREIGSDEPVTSDTLFMIGSTTKSMTTMMIATLVDDGILDWDTPVVDILPTFALSDPEVTPQIRVRHLVNMSSGVSRYDVPLFLQALAPEALIESLADIPTVAAPGTEFNYSNQMVTAGGFIAAIAAGAHYGDNVYETYADLMGARVFEPIGMTSTTLDFDAALASENHAIPHSYDIETEDLIPVATDFERFAIPVAPAGAVWSNVEDMARYLMTDLHRGVAPDGTRVVSEENLSVTQSPEIAIGGPISYSMGWLIDEFHGQPLIWHNGGTLGFSSDISFMPDAGLAVVVLTNRSAGDNFNHAVRDYVFELAFGLEHTADARYLAADEQLTALGEQMMSGIHFGAVDPDSIAIFLGEYERGVEIAMNGDQFVVVTEYGEIPLYATDQSDVFIAGGAVAGFRLVFTEDGDDVTLTIGTPLDPSQDLTLAKVG